MELGIVMVLADLVRHVRSFLGDRMVRSFCLIHEGCLEWVSDLSLDRITYSLSNLVE
jgi:hypothetical protein